MLIYHKINPIHGGSYINSPVWIKSKKATTNTINKKDSKCFLYAVSIALNREEIKKDKQKITKIKPFINKCNWQGINFPSEKDDWKKCQKNIVTIALNVLYAKKIFAYVSKKNSNLEKQVIILKIPNGKKEAKKIRRKWS